MLFNAEFGEVQTVNKVDCSDESPKILHVLTFLQTDIETIEFDFKRNYIFTFNFKLLHQFTENLYWILHKLQPSTVQQTLLSCINLNTNEHENISDKKVLKFR